MMHCQARGTVFRRRWQQHTEAVRTVEVRPEGWRVIRPAVSSDTDAIVTVWLEASIQAHQFVPEEFWRSQAPNMRDRYLPSADTYVDERHNEVTGFISLVHDRLAALFVAPAHQDGGIGTALLCHSQSLRHTLDVSVYADNERALRFYANHGFVRIGQRVDEATGAREVVMSWPATF
jgi:putative acetyltransferase